MPSADPIASLPIVDFSAFIQGKDEDRQRTAGEVVDAFKTFGFVYLVNHGISKERVRELFGWSKKFFYLPEAERAKPGVIRPPEPTTADKHFIARGYSPVGREKLSQALDDDNLKTLRQVPDVKDMFEMGPSKGPGQVREPNQYPSQEVLPGFEDFTEAFFWEAHALGLQILRATAMGLQIEPESFTSFHEDADNLFRLIRYPPIQRAAMLSGASARTAPHTDFGSITILFQDDAGGLEVENPAEPGTFIRATPVEGAVIVNIGDFLMRWSNDNLKSNLHRVVEPPADQGLSDGQEITRERFSIPFFVQADRSKVVKCAPGLEGSGAKYPPVTADEYLRMRVGATFKEAF